MKCIKPAISKAQGQDFSCWLCVTAPQYVRELKIWLNTPDFFQMMLSQGLGYWLYKCQGCPDGSDSKESACFAGDLGSIPGSGRSPGEGSGYPLRYSWLENFTDRGAWWATVRGVAKSQTQMTFSIFTVVQVPSRLHLLYQEERQNTATFKVDSQQGPTVKHMELCSALCGGLNRRGVWKGMDTCICVTEFLRRSPETLTLFVHQLYPNTKWKVFFKSRK